MRRDIADNMSMTKINIERSSGGWVDRARSYDVIVDDEPCGRLGHGEQVGFDVEPGEHSVYLGIDWCRSDMLKLKLDPEMRPVFVAGRVIR
jgi:hypothetical protein